MSQTLMRATSPAGRRFQVHRAWWIATVAGLVIVVTGASTGMPDLLTEPFHAEFGWPRGLLGAAFGVNMALYGLTAPFAAALMDRFGMRQIVTVALIAIAAGAGLTTLMTSPWQLLLGWGLLVGLGTGSLALTFAAIITNRWFTTKRGLISGILTSASMFGGMAVLPLLAWIVRQHEWRAAITAVGAAALVLVPLVLFLLRDHPADLGLKRYGATEFTPKPAPARGAGRRALTVLQNAAKTTPFWLLAMAFGVCGASTNGIMMTFFVPAAQDDGMPVTTAALLLAVMGIFNVAGATASGWLTDRCNPRWLLAIFYLLRGISLLFLPLLIDAVVHPPIMAFLVAYGLLDLATVPPTIALCREFYGNDNGPIVFGWVNAAHQLGAGAAAFSGATMRAALGSYDAVWIAAGLLCAVATGMSLAVKRSPQKPIPVG